MNPKSTTLCWMVIGMILVFQAQAQFDAMNGRSITDILSIKGSEAFVKSPLIAGSPYADDSFKLGKIFTTKGEFSGMYLRYDLYNGVIEYLEKGKHLILSAEPTIVKVEIDTTTLYNQPFYKDGRLSLGFFKMLHDKKVKLLKRQSVRFIEKPPVKALEFNSEPARFDPEPDKFFIRFENMEAKPILSIKKLIDMFPDHQKELDQFIKRNNIGLNQKGLMNLMDYYSTL